VITCD